jgi:O-acetyl-ADP-ribose deacetylase (regulator of RNase III)
MIKITEGNLLNASTEALVNTVNTEGVMGKGIALQFKQAFPNMFKAYQAACKTKEVRVGEMNIYDLGGLDNGPNWIINFPTKSHWRSKSRIQDIELGLIDLIKTIKRLEIKSIAIPPLGCGYGGLDWEEVRPLIEQAFSNLTDVDIRLYSPSGAPAITEMFNNTNRPNMTEGRASLIILMTQYLNGQLSPFISLLEIHKLMYFMQESGQKLRLSYEAKQYGPYAKEIRQVLIKLDGHYLQGYGDGQDNPDKPIEILPDAFETAMDFLSNHADVLDRMAQVHKLIEGFEDPYGMELLSSVHWVMAHNEEAKINPEVAIQEVQKWNNRKKLTLKPAHMLKAWQRLKDNGWDSHFNAELTPFKLNQPMSQ